MYIYIDFFRKLAKLLFEISLFAKIKNCNEMKSLRSHLGANRSSLTSQRKISLEKPKSATGKPKPSEGVTVNVAAAFGTQATKGKLISLKILVKYRS